MALIEKAMNEPELVSMAIRSVFDIPPEMAAEAEEKSTVIEIIKYIAAHPGESKTVLDTILGSAAGVFAPLASLVMPKTPPPQTMDINAFRQPRNEQPPVSPPEMPATPPQTPK
jgi:hypothetical protein